MGKTTLLDAFVATLPPGRVAMARTCPEAGSPPRWPWMQNPGAARQRPRGRVRRGGPRGRGHRAFPGLLAGHSRAARVGSTADGARARRPALVGSNLAGSARVPPRGRQRGARLGGDRGARGAPPRCGVARGGPRDRGVSRDVGLPRAAAAHRGAARVRGVCAGGRRAGSSPSASARGRALGVRAELHANGGARREDRRRSPVDDHTDDHLRGRPLRGRPERCHALLS